MLASVASHKAGRKTLKGQRTAEAKAAVKTPRRVKAAAQVKEAVDQILGWQLPVPFTSWVSWHTDGNVPDHIVHRSVSDWGRIGWDFVKSLDSSLLLAQASLREQYRRYVNHVFSQPIQFSHVEGNAFDKIVTREEWLERQGKHDLGLLGYSAIDRVQIAVHYAWVMRVMRWLEQTGADKAYVQEMGQALRDLRSDDELRSVAELEGRSRYTVSKETDSENFPRIRKQSQLEVVTIAARRLELRAEFATFPIATSGYAADWTPAVGDVYRALHAVTKEGLRKFRNTLEGLTHDGVISDTTQFVAGHRQDLVEAGATSKIKAHDSSLIRSSVEDELFNKHQFSESHLVRRLAQKQLATQVPASVVEANTSAAAQMLIDGASLLEIREAFSDLSERAFSRLFSDSEILISEVTASDIFLAKLHKTTTIAQLIIDGETVADIQKMVQGLSEEDLADAQLAIE